MRLRAQLSVGLAATFLATPAWGQHSAPAADDAVIVVTGSRREELQSEAAVKTEVITQADIDASGAVDVADLLTLYPGVEVTPGVGGQGISIRGMSSEYIVILIDGERVNGRVDGLIDLSRLTLDNVERVEIVKGPSSALYGSNAMGGVINIITKKPEAGLKGDGSLSWGNLGAVDASTTANYGGARARGMVNAAYHRIDAYDLDPTDAATTGSASEQGDIRASATVSPGGAWSMELGASYLRRQQEGIDSFASGAILDRTNLTEVADASLGVTAALSSRDHLRAEASVTLFRDQYLSDQRGSDSLDTYQETRDQLLQIDGQWNRALSRQSVMTAGAELLAEGIHTPRVESGQASRVRGATFAQLDARLANGDVALVPGARVDADSQFGVFASPKIAARFHANPKLTLRADIGRGYRAPDFKQLYLIFENPGAGYRVEGNPALTPERSWQGSAGATLFVSQRLSLSAALFSNHLTDMIGVDVVNASDGEEITPYTYVNIASARLSGAEASIELHPTPGLTARAAYVFLNTVDQTTGEALEGRAPHRVTALMRWHGQRLGLVSQIRASVSGPRPFYLFDPDVGDLALILSPTSVQLDARIAKDLGRRLTVFIAGQNLTNSGDAIFNPQQPRSARLGLSGRF